MRESSGFSENCSRNAFADSLYFPFEYKVSAEVFSIGLEKHVEAKKKNKGNDHKPDAKLRFLTVAGKIVDLSTRTGMSAMNREALTKGVKVKGIFDLLGLNWSGD